MLTEPEVLGRGLTPGVRMPVHITSLILICGLFAKLLKELGAYEAR